ncbi:hypothetical protein NYP18_07150 [Corynebacterium sp. YIM 101645]|uniref:VWFA domain-containing protein n=1 Tax=Corynebacterium lemuris TaxID=1859292 RepID=A0ABT2FW19_9CORY|nr:hypothetical protein [Corynebacterium lemuris]MCS5479431.1 hypothetical protein [Corynebacterium lemuris]
MARHRSGKNNYAVSGTVIIAGVVVLALIAATVWWVSFRGTTEEQAQAPECIQGELILPVAEASPGLEAGLINQWNATEPIVRDHCVTAERVSSVDDAAVLITHDNPEADSQLGERTASSVVPVDMWAGQLWTNGEAELDGVDPAAVTYPVATDPDTAVAVAVALAGDRAPELIARDREVTVDTEAEILAVGPAAGIHKGMGTTRDVEGAEVVILAHVLNPAGGITEEQTRAAAEFTRFHNVSEQIPADLPDRTAAWAAVTADPVEEAPAEETAAPEPEAILPADTLLLFDTSAGTATDFGGGSIHSETANSLRQIALDLGGGGRQVALWNYSSPINPGVTQGWRRNVGFSDGTRAAEAVLRFGTGGVPQTRSALVAAVATAADKSRETGETTRVLLVTTGTEQDMDDAAFTDALNQARGDADVRVETIHVGGGGVDGVLAEQSTLTHITDPAQLDAGLRAAAGL